MLVSETCGRQVKQVLLWKDWHRYSSKCYLFGHVLRSCPSRACMR